MLLAVPPDFPRGARLIVCGLGPKTPLLRGGLRLVAGAISTSPSMVGEFDTLSIRFVRCPVYCLAMRSQIRRTALLWSNGFYLVPAVLAAQYQLWLTVIFSLGVALFGVLYHLSREKRFFLLDTSCAWLLIATNLVLCYLGGFQAPYFWIACLFLGLALFYHYYPWRRGAEYELNHSLWHLYGALITVFCILTFVL